MKIQENIPLAQYTTFKIGGAAKFFCEAKDEKDILEALEFAREKNLPVFVLGGGSNVLVSDKGFEGVVIRLRNSQLVIRNSDIICDGGVSLGKAVSESAKDGLAGLEWAAGIPGTIGGAARGNAGAFGATMGDIIESVKVLNVDDLQLKIFASGMCGYEYRNSVFKQNSNLIILSANLKLKKGDKEKSQKIVKEILEKRKEKQPMEFPSPGSFFRNPETENENLIKQFETDTGKKITDHVSGSEYAGAKRRIPAPWLIEEAGLKGKKIGGAMVSEKHANFIVNTGDATAENVIMLAAIIKTKVRNKFGIQLQEEVQMVGF